MISCLAAKVKNIKMRLQNDFEFTVSLVNIEFEHGLCSDGFASGLGLLHLIFFIQKFFYCFFLPVDISVF